MTIKRSPLIEIRESMPLSLFVFGTPSLKTVLHHLHFAEANWYWFGLLVLSCATAIAAAVGPSLITTRPHNRWRLFNELSARFYLGVLSYCLALFISGPFGVNQKLLRLAVAVLGVCGLSFWLEGLKLTAPDHQVTVL